MYFWHHLSLDVKLNNVLINIFNLYPDLNNPSYLPKSLSWPPIAMKLHLS